MLSDDEIKARILWKLRRRGNIAHSHTSFDNLVKGFEPRFLGKKGHKRIRELAEDMIREGLLNKKPTSYGLEVSLNSTRMKDIEDIIKKVQLPL